MNLPFIPLTGLPVQWARFLNDTLIKHLRVHKGVTGRPTVTTTQRDNIAPVNGDSVYNSTTGKVEVYESPAWVSSPVNQSASYSTSNVSVDRTFDADATSTAELADVLGTLIADLKASGIIQ